MEKVLCIKRSDLFNEKYLSGYLSDDILFSHRIEKNSFFKERDLVESDFSIKQIIPYVIIFDRDMQRVFIYNRDGSEQRLVDLWSFGFGGHIKEGDINIRNATYRELEEETTLREFNFQPFGFVNSDCDAVSRVHFGVVFYAAVSEMGLKGDENKLGIWLDLTELNRYKFETWSEILKPVILEKWGK